MDQRSLDRLIEIRDNLPRQSGELRLYAAQCSEARAWHLYAAARKLDAAMQDILKATRMEP